MRRLGGTLNFQCFRNVSLSLYVNLERAGSHTGENDLNNELHDRKRQRLLCRS